MNQKEKLTEATVLALQGKLEENEKDEFTEFKKDWRHIYNLMKSANWTDENVKTFLEKIPYIFYFIARPTYKFIQDFKLSVDQMLRIVNICKTKERDYDHLHKVFDHNEDILQKFLNNELSDEDIKHFIYYNSFYTKNKKNIPYLRPYKVNTAKSSGMRSGSDISNTFENSDAAPLIFEAIYNLEQALNPYNISINDLQLVYLDRATMLMGIFLQDEKTKDIITSSGNSRNLIKNTAACQAIYNEKTKEYDISFRYAVHEQNLDITSEGLKPSEELIDAIVKYFNSIDDNLIQDYKRRYKKD